MNIDMASHGIVAVVRKDDRFLLIKEARDVMHGHWGPPHGRVNPEDRTEEDAVIRETKEEIGIDIRPIKKIVTVAADVKTKTLSFWLVEQVGEQNMIFDPSEISESGWFTVSEALDLPLYPATKKLFSDILSGLLSLD